jgi:transposase-like protein
MARIKYLEALGREVKRGRPPVGPAPSRADLVKLYVKEGCAVREVAAALGCSKDMVHRMLRKYGIEARPKAKRSGLRKYGIKTLRTAAKKKSVRGAARELGVNPSTLSRFLRSDQEK